MADTFYDRMEVCGPPASEPPCGVDRSLRVRGAEGWEEGYARCGFPFPSHKQVTDEPLIHCRYALAALGLAANCMSTQPMIEGEYEKGAQLPLVVKRAAA